MNEKIEIFQNWEQEDELIVKGKCSKKEALYLAKKEYPEIAKIYDISCVHSVVMYRCLDCGSYWISDDVCGECGEYRLSKRGKQGWHIF